MERLFMSIVFLSIIGTITFFLSFILLKWKGKNQCKRWTYFEYIFLMMLWILPSWKIFSLFDYMEPNYSEKIQLAMQETKMVKSYIEYSQPSQLTDTLSFFQYDNVSNWLVVGWITLSIILILNFMRLYLKDKQQILTTCFRRNKLIYILKDELIKMKLEKCKVRIYVSTRIRSPILLGVINYKIIIPNIDLDDNELRMIIRHELTHLKRKDNWVRLFAYFIQCIHWFNPMIYIFNQQMELLCESSCDEIMILKMEKPERKMYSEAILHVLEQTKGNQKKSFIGELNFCKKQHQQLVQRFQDIIQINRKQNNSMTIITLLLSICISFHCGFIVTALDDRQIDFKENDYAHVYSLINTNVAMTKGIFDRPMTIRNGEAVTYFQKGHKRWALKKGDKVEIKITAEVWSHWPSRGEMSVGYNVNNSIFNPIEQINEIKYFNIEDQAQIYFEVPIDGYYSFVIENVSSEKYCIKNVRIKVTV